MNFPVVIHKDKSSDYGVTVPDIPGCFTAGRTIDEALDMAKEAIELSLEQLIENGQTVPSPSRIEELQRDPEFRGGIWALVRIDETTLRIQAKRINITVPERVLDILDRYAAEHGETRSGLLVRAAIEFIGRGDDRSLPKAKRGRPAVGKKTRCKSREV